MGHRASLEVGHQCCLELDHLMLAISDCPWGRPMPCAFSLCCTCQCASCGLALRPNFFFQVWLFIFQYQYLGSKTELELLWTVIFQVVSNPPPLGSASMVAYSSARGRYHFSTSTTLTAMAELALSNHRPRNLHEVPAHAGQKYHSIIQ